MPNQAYSFNSSSIGENEARSEVFISTAEIGPFLDDNNESSANEGTSLRDEFALEVGQRSEMTQDLLELARQEIGLSVKAEPIELLEQTYIEIQSIQKDAPPASKIIVSPEQEVEHSEEAELFGVFQIVEQKVDELEPTKVPELEILLQEAMVVLTTPEQPAGSSETSLIYESEVQQLTHIVEEIFQMLGIEVEEVRVTRIAHMLVTKKYTFNEFKQQKESTDRGTHEILQHIASLFSNIKEVLEPLHALLGRMVLLSTAPQKSLQAA